MQLHEFVLLEVFAWADVVGDGDEFDGPSQTLGALHLKAVLDPFGRLVKEVEGEGRRADDGCFDHHHQDKNEHHQQPQEDQRDQYEDHALPPSRNLPSPL